MSLQRQHFLLSYLKTLSVGPAGVRTHDLPHGNPVLNQLSQPVGGYSNDISQFTAILPQMENISSVKLTTETRQAFFCIMVKLGHGRAVKATK